MTSFTAHPLCKLEGYRVCIMHGKFFVLEANSVCSNVVPLLNRTKHCVSLLTQHYESHDLDDATESIL